MSAKPTVYYVTGPLHSGKTTRLRQWCEKRTDVAGVFQPVMDRKRYFIDIQTGQRRGMDADASTERVWEIGKYHFAIEAFEWAARILLEAARTPDVHYLIVDEVGPLEMRHEGMDDAIHKLLAGSSKTIILVIRDYLLEQVLNHYGIEEAEGFSYEL